MQNTDRPRGDAHWLLRRAGHSLSDAPLNAYEVHLGSWRRTGEGGRLSCREIAGLLIPYVKQMGFTHVHLLPVAEHPADDPWGYRCTEPFALAGSYGPADGFRYLVDELHRAGVGVFLDLVCTGLSEGDALRCALFWLEEYHLDGLRPVCVPHDPDLLDGLCRAVLAVHPDVCMMGDGPGATLNWTSPFSPPEAPPCGERMLALSHDEVTGGKGSLLSRMPGSDPFAAARAFYTYMLACPGKKLTMMGTEFGQWKEWDSVHSLDWHLPEQADEDGQRHRQLQTFFRRANHMYLQTPALWRRDGCLPLCADRAGRVFAFLRADRRGRSVLMAANFSPEQRSYRIGVPHPGRYLPVFHTDRPEFGGEGRLFPPLRSEPIPRHGMEHSLTLDLPPMSTILLTCPCKNGKKMK